MTVTYTINHAISDALETWLVAQPDFVSIDLQPNVTHVYYDHASTEEELAFKNLLANQLGLTGENVNTSDVGLFAVGGVITPTALTGQHDDYDPPGLSGASIIRLESEGNDWQISGLAGGYEGRIITIINIGEGFTITLLSQDTGSIEANQFQFNNANIEMGIFSSVTLRYDGISSVWRAMSSAIADDSITSQHIIDGAISPGKIQDEGVIGTKLAPDSDGDWNLGTTTGVKLGTATNQKLGFFNKAPVVQPAANADTSGATLGDLETEVNQLKALLRTLGLMAT